MKTPTLFICLLLLSSLSMGQAKYGTKTGAILFEASVASFEEVKAQNENVSAVLNTSNGEFAALALVKGFRFKVALMEEHFNENYMESSQFPKAVVKGSLKDFEMSKLTEGVSEFMLKGTITIHGITKPLETLVQIKKIENTLVLETEFILKPEYFEIEIPKIVSNKVAKEVFVTATFSLSN